LIGQHACLPSLRGARDKIAKQFCAEATKQSTHPLCRDMDCFAEPVIGRRFAPTRWLAVTGMEPIFGIAICIIDVPLRLITGIRLG
jgi:hypothetical protein